MRAFGPPSTAGPVQALPARPGPVPLAGRATPPAPAAQRDVLQRDVVQRDVTDDKDFATAAGDPNRRRDAVVYLGTHPDAAAKTAKLDLATVEALLPLVGPTEHTARGALLERGFVITTKENPNWEKAVGFVMVLDDPGIVRNVATLTDKEAKLLAKGARLAGRAGDQRLMDPIRKKIRREAPGQLFGTVTHKMEPHDGVYNRWGGNGMFSCKMRIEFEPDPDVCEATSIAFVQTVSMLAGKKSVDNRDDMPGRFNSKKQGIDRPDKSTSGFYSASGGGFNKLTGYSGVQPGISSGGTMVPAIMVDTPDGVTENVTYSYETSIVAKEGTDAGFVYAVVLWSFTVNGAMKVVPNPVELKQVPHRRLRCGGDGLERAGGSEQEGRTAGAPRPAARGPAAGAACRVAAAAGPAHARHRLAGAVGRDPATGGRQPGEWGAVGAGPAMRRHGTRRLRGRRC